MEGWISRTVLPFGRCEDHRAISGVTVEGQVVRHDDTALDPRSVYARHLLPVHERALRVEGGAPYYHSYGRPQYLPQEYDTAATYPLLTPPLAIAVAA